MGAILENWQQILTVNRNINIYKTAVKILMYQTVNLHNTNNTFALHEVDFRYKLLTNLTFC